MSAGLDRIASGHSLKRVATEEPEGAPGRKKARAEAELARQVAEPVITPPPEEAQRGKKRKAEETLLSPEEKKPKKMSRKRKMETDDVEASEAPQQKKTRTDDHEFVPHDREVEKLIKLIKALTLKSSCNDKPTLHYPRYTEAF